MARTEQERRDDIYDMVANVESYYLDFSQKSIKQLYQWYNGEYIGGLKLNLARIRYVSQRIKDN